MYCYILAVRRSEVRAELRSLRLAILAVPSQKLRGYGVVASIVIASRLGEVVGPSPPSASLSE